ncbi:hypothetical protein [Maricaulis sp. CAU 1757]
MYTEDGFELRPIGGTLEIYASGEFFHDPESPLFRAIDTLSRRTPFQHVLFDLRLASFILEETELAALADRLAELLAPFACALIGLSDQTDLVERLTMNMRTKGARVRHFSGKQQARDWLARQSDQPGSRKRRLDVRHLPPEPARGRRTGILRQSRPG